MTGSSPDRRNERDFAPVTSDVEGRFPWHVWHERHPRLIQQLGELHPLGGRERTSLAELVDESLTGVIRPLETRASDRGRWREWVAPYLGASWLAAPFLWAESYFYRRLLEATGYYGSGVWASVDPFAPLKRAELATAGMADLLKLLDTVTGLDDPTALATLIQASLWGNRADLGFQIGMAVAAGQAAPTGSLVYDDSAALVELLGGRVGAVCVVADNAGLELAADLLLVDLLLSRDLAGTVEVHLKPAPYYVSDATGADLGDILRHFTAAGAAAAAVAGRLHAAAAAGRLRPSTHAFYTAPHSYHVAPADLREQYRAADLVVMKGDLNYRRLVGDLHLPPTTPFAARTGYFPTAVACLRTLKSDVVVGVDPADVDYLDACGLGWRTGGSHALVQLRA